MISQAGPSEYKSFRINTCRTSSNEYRIATACNRQDVTNYVSSNGVLVAKADSNSQVNTRSGSTNSYLAAKFTLDVSGLSGLNALPGQRLKTLTCSTTGCYVELDEDFSVRSGCMFSSYCAPCYRSLGSWLGAWRVGTSTADAHCMQ